MTEEILFISDLHLAAERPQIIDLFGDFVDDIAVGADTLYILGDFLEYWIGDDGPATGLQPVFDAMVRLHMAGTAVRFMHGNRDFLIGEDLAQRCHFDIIPDPTVENLHGERVLLMHGDLLCTDDFEYQKFRAMVRNPAWIADVMSKPVEQRLALAASLRDTSKQAVAEKSEYIMDVNQQAVKAFMREQGAKLLIHGHTHRPGIHEFKLDDTVAKRIVLGDWYDSGSYLRFGPNGPEMKLL
jgi:UDP-2,3-diacylglucosamine hydrolase